MNNELTGGALLALAIFLAIFVETTVERAFGSITILKGWPMIMISMATGIALCIGLNIDILALVGFEGNYISWIGQVMSGIIIGSGSNLLHKYIPPTG